MTVENKQENTELVQFEEARNQCRNKLFNLFKSNTKYIKNNENYTKSKRITKKIMTDYSSKIEDGVYKYAINKCGGYFYYNITFKRQYRNKMISLFRNLNPDDKDIKNKNLIIRLFNNDVNGEDLASMKPDDLFPEHWKEIKDKHDSNEKYIYSKKYGAISSTEICRKCNVPNTVTYYTMQTRSIDEPDTIFFICTNKKCGNRWKC